MTTEMEFTGKDIKDAVRKACQAHLVEPKMLEYEVLEEKEAVVTRFSRSQGSCKIRVTKAELILDDLPDAPPGNRDDRGPRGDRGGRDRGGRDRGGRDRGGRDGGGRDGGGRDRGGRDRGGRGDRGGRRFDRGGRDERGRDDSPRLPMDPDAAAASAEKSLEILNGILTRMGFEAELNVTDGDDFVRVDIDCEDPDLIAGGGEIFDALQYITNIVVSVRGRGKRVYVDFNGSQKKREAEMTTLANEIAEKVLASGEALKLEPMSAGDRRFIHRALTDVEGVSTRSEGEGAFRHLLVVPE